jgi:hypothetical protein
LTTGGVKLPRRRIHAGIWFRLLRTLLDEVNTPLSQCGTCAEGIRQVWARSGHPPRAGQNLWRPYEALDLKLQLQMLEAVAAAIDLIESKSLRPQGKQAELFVPPTDLPVDEPKTAPSNSWREAFEALNKSIAEAQSNPEAARSLFAIASYGRRDPKSLEDLRSLFAEVGIPHEYLSSYMS